jgi:hypothetical protein
MSWRVAFGPLLRALTGGRFPTQSGPATTGVSPLAISHLTSQAFADLLKTGSLYPHFHYRPFTRPKKDGTRREIVEPDARLKRVQREIVTRYLQEEPHDAAIAYRRKKSVADHVWAHADADWLVTADVQDFFPSTSAGRVEDWWRQRVGDEPGRVLTLLTTFRGALPQGAPTSPTLSNLINFEMDEKLTNRAQLAGARYTRYCDDLVFSWRLGAVPPSDFETAVRATLSEFGYTLHPAKGWRLHSRLDEPEITGAILTRYGRVRLPERLRKKMRALERSSDPRDAQRLSGYMGYEEMIGKKPRTTTTRRTPRPIPAPRPIQDVDGEEIPF